MTSNDGFSVVAPMKVNSPDSTCGRKASCCALLKRCTSSTNTTVARPAVRAARARSTASRISLTPDSTADSTMNCASTMLATSRASVVLPTPGGPHRIIECRRPDSNATRNGRPGPSRWRWPITWSRWRGRNRSASGASAAGGSSAAARALPPASASNSDSWPLIARPSRRVGCANPCAIVVPRGRRPPRSLLDHVGALGRREAKRVLGQLGVLVQRGEVQARALAKGIDDVERRQLLALEADAQRLDRTVLHLGRGLHPLQPIGRRRRFEVELLVERGAGQKGRWRGAERLGHGPHGDLVQVHVVQPHLLAVGDDLLLERLGVAEAESIRPHELELPRRFLFLLAVGRGHRLREAGLAGLHVLRKVAQQIDGVG